MAHIQSTMRAHTAGVEHISSAVQFEDYGPQAKPWFRARVDGTVGALALAIGVFLHEAVEL